MFFGTELFVALFLTHFITDFGLQSAAMAAGKTGDLPCGHDGPSRVDWLVAHCLINAAGVYLVTGLIWLTVIEFVLHMLIDWSKGEGWLNYRQDQGLHWLCKFLYCLA